VGHNAARQVPTAGPPPSPRALRPPCGLLPKGIVDSIIVAIVPKIENPDFYSLLDAQGIPQPFDFRPMHGITFVDTVCISAERASGSATELSALLFHEVVHVAQYDLLGIGEFMRRYVLGWAENGRSYDRIPLEVQAKGLEATYRESGDKPFTVLPLVRKQLGLAP
jgi:hypothetical protein